MCNNFIRNSFLLACASFVIPNVKAMEPLDTDTCVTNVAVAPEKSLEQQWEIKEYNYGRYLPELYTYIAAVHLLPKNKVSLISEFFIGRDATVERNTITFFIEALKSEYGKDQRLHDIANKIRGTLSPHENQSTISLPMDNSNWNIVCPDVVAYKLLPVLCDNELIPASYILPIVQHIGLKDGYFESMIDLINLQMGNDPTVNGLERIVHAELAKLTNLKFRAEITWDLVKDLKEKLQDGQLVYQKPLITLCNQITDEKLPFFKDAQELNAELTFTLPDKISIEDRYKKMILLHVSSDKKPGSVKPFAHPFVNNGALGGESLPFLDNLTVTPNSVFTLLNHIRLQNMDIGQKDAEIQKLQDQIKELQAGNSNK